jgi:hypothetical protein
MDNLQELTYNNLLLVAGTGRNSGKTSFVCRICEEWDISLPLVCIKISNHIHVQEGTRCVFSGDQFTIYEETQSITDKDTDRMLRAGASKVLFIEADREFVYPAFRKALETVPVGAAIICESGSLRRYARPSLFIMLHTLGSEPKESSRDLMNLADNVFYFENGNLQIPKRPVVFTNNQWKLNSA